MTEPKKPVRRKAKAAKEIPVAISPSLSELFYEIDTLKIAMEFMSDDGLYDFCLEHIDMYKHYELDKLYPKLALGDKLTKDERKQLEAFCILANTEMFLNE